MKKLAIVLLATALATPAFAWNEHVVVPPPKPKAMAPHEPGHHIGAGPWIAGGIIGCGALTLMGSAAYVGSTQHRELTLKEAHMAVWGCAIPIVGALIVHAMWRPEWDHLSTAPAPIR